MENKQALTKAEVTTIQMALAAMIEDVELASKNPSIPFTPKSRIDMKDILLNAKAAKAKIDSIVGKEVTLAPYIAGDEKEFLTKES